MREEIIQIDVESELQHIISQLHTLPDQMAAPKVLKNALNSAARKVRKQMLADVRSTYAVQNRKALRDTSQGGPKVLEASAAGLSAAVQSRGPMQEIRTFRTRPNTRTRAAQAQVLASGALKALEIDGRKAFLTAFRNGHSAIVQRTGRGRYPIKKLLSPSVPHMLAKDTVMDRAEETAYDLLQAEIRKRIAQINLT